MRTDSHSDPDSEYARHARALRDAEAAGNSTAHAALVAEYTHREAVHAAVESLRRRHAADADFISDCD